MKKERDGSLASSGNRPAVAQIASVATCLRRSKVFDVQTFLLLSISSRSCYGNDLSKDAPSAGIDSTWQIGRPDHLPLKLGATRQMAWGPRWWNGDFPPVKCDPWPTLQAAIRMSREPSSHCHSPTFLRGIYQLVRIGMPDVVRKRHRLIETWDLVFPRPPGRSLAGSHSCEARR